MGGLARAEAARKRRSRSVFDVLRGRVVAEPEAFVDHLLASPAGAVKAAAVLEKAGALEPKLEDTPRSVPPSGGVAPTSLRDVVELAYRHGLAASFGLPVTVEQFQELMAEGEGAAERRRSPVPSGDPLRVPASSTDPIPATNPPPTEAAPTPVPEPAASIPSEPPDQGAEARMRSEHARMRAELGLPPDDGNNEQTVGRRTPERYVDP